MIEILTSTGDKLLINPDYIVSISSEGDDLASIHMLDKTTYYISTSMYEVLTEKIRRLKYLFGLNNPI